MITSHYSITSTTTTNYDPLTSTTLGTICIPLADCTNVMGERDALRLKPKTRGVEALQDLEGTLCKALEDSHDNVHGFVARHAALSHDLAEATQICASEQLRRAAAHDVEQPNTACADESQLLFSRMSERLDEMDNMRQQNLELEDQTLANRENTTKRNSASVSLEDQEKRTSG